MPISCCTASRSLKIRIPIIFVKGAKRAWAPQKLSKFIGQLHRVRPCAAAFAATAVDFFGKNGQVFVYQLSPRLYPKSVFIVPDRVMKHGRRMRFESISWLAIEPAAEELKQWN
jgi:hypothetical protein